MAGAGSKVERCTVTNAYQFLDIEVGRTIVDDVFVGAFLVGIHVDHAQDHVALRNIVHSVFWDAIAGASPYPSNIDKAYVLKQSYAFQILRADSLEIHNVLVFARYAAFFLTDSPDSTPPRCGYGTASNVDIDTVQYGMIVSASNSPGYKFANVDFGAAPPNTGVSGQAAVYFQNGGSIPPKVLINGGSIRGSWVAPFAQNGVAGSDLKVGSVFGYAGF
jgi:hypothetical protein